MRRGARVTIELDAPAAAQPLRLAGTVVAADADRVIVQAAPAVGGAGVGRYRFNRLPAGHPVRFGPWPGPPIAEGIVVRGYGQRLSLNAVRALDPDETPAPSEDGAGVGLASHTRPGG